MTTRTSLVSRISNSFCEHKFFQIVFMVVALLHKSEAPTKVGTMHPYFSVAIFATQTTPRNYVISKRHKMTTYGQPLNVPFTAKKYGKSEKITLICYFMAFINTLQITFTCTYNVVL